MFYIIDSDFPDPSLADEEGLLAIGGNLEPETLLKAYSMGIYPWYSDDEPILWWCPNPRLVLMPQDVVVSKSMKQFLKKNKFKYTIDEAFANVIDACRNKRLDNTGTWITPEIKAAYIKLFELGYAHSVEVWEGENLVGGLYGVQIGKVFFGESMFSYQSNASKAALIFWCMHCIQNGIELIDCQQSTHHLKSMGAIEISRQEFLHQLENLIDN
ncbi:MAG: leucyl/phenylalanyl-tRNA--protein transferase [Bacteroidota bacterium]|nr:leucyl/phenylalanyl-tRNA--protein transferase [Bacteroidota bacterium]